MAFARYCRSWYSPFLQHRPWPSSPAIASKLNPAQPIEEEKTPFYSQESFYPARLGEVLKERYQLVTKLGHGSSSTVWLARDLYGWRWSKDQFVAIKITSKKPVSRRDGAKSEIATMNLITKANPRHEGWHFVRKLINSFSLDGKDGVHDCLVFEALREPLWLYRRRYSNNVIPASILKILVQMILHGIDYLHSECKIVHTDLKLDNIMVKIEDPSLLDKSAQDEHFHPLPQKHIDGRVIYLSRNDYGPLTTPSGIIRITDFDLSVSGDMPRSGCIQVDIYRAPEVILDVGYSYAADIWNLGVLLWDLLEGRSLFHLAEEKVKDCDERKHLALMTSLLGPPPKGLDNGRRSSMFYSPAGDFKFPDLIPNDFDFDSSISSISGEEKKRFIRFAKRMITWRPEDRGTAKELLQDPWLHTDFPQD